MNNHLKKNIQQFIGQEIILSSDWKAMYKGRDTVLTDFREIDVKMVIFNDSLLCGSCQAGRMFEWNDIVAYADSSSQKFFIIYLFSPRKEDINRLNISLKANKFNYPIFIDINSSFIKQNPHLPKNQQLHTFLLDKNNKVVLVGSPLFNPALWELYKSTIQKMIDNDGVLPDQ
ncbi:MAG: hypothetical protein FWG54_04565 [Bacteroidetes bacterium]|nr:hypothetical protein [Bacteroidota bacterium]